VSTPYGPYDPGQQQGGYPPQDGYPPQGGNAPQGGYPPQGGYARQGGYPPQGGYARQGGYPPQGGYAQQGGYPPQGGGYTAYPQQQGGYAPAGAPRGYLQGGPVGFIDAIKLAFQNIFEYNGRASRSSYWWFALAELIGWVGILILAVIFAAVHAPIISILLYLAAGIASFLVSLALTIRRLHDQDKSGFWYFIAFVPFIGGIWLLVLTVMEGTPGPNRFG
jgi:uncharacterized membrane protein YhaH (DUF805 family)